MMLQATPTSFAQKSCTHVMKSSVKLTQFEWTWSNACSVTDKYWNYI